MLHNIPIKANIWPSPPSSRHCWTLSPALNKRRAAAKRTGSHEWDAQPDQSAASGSVSRRLVVRRVLSMRRTFTRASLWFGPLSSCLRSASARRVAFPAAYDPDPSLLVHFHLPPGAGQTRPIRRMATILQ